MSEIILNEEQKKIYEDVLNAYIFTYPLVETVVYSKAKTNTVKANAEQAPYNQFSHNERTWTPEEHKPGGPNMDTVYSMAVLKLGKDGLILHKPATDRFYTCLFLDAYGNYRALVGSGGLGGHSEGNYFLTGPDFEGAVPEEMTHIAFPTSFVTVLLRIQIYAARQDDIKNIRKYQKETYFIPAEAFGTEYTFPDGEYKEENDYNSYVKMQQMDLESFFGIFNQYSIENPIVSEDKAEAAKYEKYGIRPGGEFSLSAFKDEALIRKLKEIPQTIRFEMEDKNIRNGWKFLSPDITLPGSDYYERAYSIHWGPGCNPAEAAVYPTASADRDGNPLSGKHKYVVHFNAGSLPPVGEDGYWSFSAYTVGDLYLIQNDAGIYKVGSESNLQFYPDGSLDIFIQHEAPKEADIQNWLPVGEGEFTLIFRVYIPDKKVIDGTWQPPYIDRID